jgi:hypothetical protein
MLIDMKKKKKRESRASTALGICTDGGEGPRPTLRSRPQRLWRPRPPRPATHVPRKSNNVGNGERGHWVDGLKLEGGSKTVTAQRVLAYKVTRVRLGDCENHCRAKRETNPALT